jgi:mono/diheme cytochrome c family protein
MKKLLLITAIGATLAGCGAGKNPGYAYMPDMYYSVANETYASAAALKNAGVNYTGLPVAGAVARDEDLNFVYPYQNNPEGYRLSATVKNPLTDSLGMSTVNMVEAERLYLINCGICHGANLDGNGPLFNKGAGPFTAAPRNFMDPVIIDTLKEGTMFHSITYGLRAMGSSASQLTPLQRWEVISYIRFKQKPTAPADTAAVAKN